MNGKVILYTDGECCGGEGPGGYAAIIQFFDENGKSLKELEIFGGEAETTPERAELMALVVGLKALGQTSAVTVVSDSEFINALTENPKRTQNQDLWVILDRLYASHLIEFKTAQDPISTLYHKRCSQLAQFQRDQFDKMQRASTQTYQAV